MICYLFQIYVDYNLIYMQMFIPNLLFDHFSCNKSDVIFLFVFLCVFFHIVGANLYLYEFKEI